MFSLKELKKINEKFAEVEEKIDNGSEDIKGLQQEVRQLQDLISTMWDESHPKTF